MSATAKLHINHLRSRGAVAEPIIARLALEALAGELAEVHTQIPPQAVLIVRRLALAIGSNTLSRYPDPATRNRFARQGQQALAQAASSAARPALGAVPAQTEAVLFADEAEMLACLARDGLTGRLDCWWWRVVLAAAFPHWPQAFAQRTHAVVPALRLLAKADLAPTVRLELSRENIFTGRDDPVLPSPWIPARNTALQSDISIFQPHQPERSRPPMPGTPRIQIPSADGTTLQTAVQPPAVQILPANKSAGEEIASFRFKAKPTSSRPLSEINSAQADSPPQPTSLLATGNSPALPAGKRFRSVEVIPDHAPHFLPVEKTKQASSAPEEIMENTEIPNPIRPGNLRVAQPGAIPTKISRLSAEINRLMQDNRKPGAQPVNTFLGPDAMPNVPTEGETDFILPDTALPPAQAAPDNALAYPPLAIDSAYAGAFFLVNILLGDGIYPDFTRPLDPGFPVPLWRLLALLAERLTGAKFRSDPVWDLLDLLTADLPVDEYADFADWPAPKVRPDYHPAHNHNRRNKPQRRQPTRAGAGRLQDWLRRYADSVRIRLADAFAMPSLIVGKFLVAQPARIHLSAGEIVVVHALDTYPVDIRLAGLDRDPGYLPSAGRTLRFVFA